MSQGLFSTDRGVIVAVDVPTIFECAQLAFALRGVEGISAFKLGFEIGYRGLSSAVAAIRFGFGRRTKVIFDHQKAGTDIPEQGQRFAKTLRKSGVDAAILFPLAGRATQSAWTHACRDEGLEVMIGSVMTHAGFLKSDGGYVDDSAPRDITLQACVDGVEHYIVPGNNPAWVKRIRMILTNYRGEGSFTLSAPGFITQGGDIADSAHVAGPRFQAIVGRAIYTQPTMKAMRIAAEKCVRSILR